MLLSRDKFYLVGKVCIDSMDNCYPRNEDADIWNIFLDLAKALTELAQEEALIQECIRS